MSGKNFYLLTALPSLGEPGAEPPISPAQLLEHVAEAKDPTALIEALLLADDLLQRESLATGQIDQASPVVLSQAQLRDNEPLPPALAAEAESDETSGPRLAADAVWDAYYHWAAELARAEGSEFLAAWIEHEVTLRGALTEARAKTLGLDVQAYAVASDLAGDAAGFDSLLNEWSAAPNPLAGLRVLDRARWQWLAEHDAWFSFHNDELAAYAAKLMILTRWHRLSRAEAEASSARPGAPSERAEP